MHYVFEILKIIDLREIGNCPCLYCVIVVLIGVSFFLIAITAICNTWARSSFLEKQ